MDNHFEIIRVIFFLLLLIAVFTPHATASSDYYTLNIKALTNTPVRDTVAYLGNLPKAPVANPDMSKIYIPLNGSIEHVEIYDYSGTAGTAEPYSYYLRLNNSTDYLISTLSIRTSERVFRNSALSIPVTEGDYFEIKRVHPNWVTTPATNIVGGYVLVNTSVDKYDTFTVEARQNYPPSSRTEYIGANPVAPSRYAIQNKVVFPFAGTVVRAEIYDYSGTPGTAEPWSYYIRKNNIANTLIATLSQATPERIFSNSGLSIPMATSDYFQITRANPTWTTRPNANNVSGYVGYNSTSRGYILDVLALTSTLVNGQVVYFGNLPKAPNPLSSQSKIYIPVAGNITHATVYTYSGTAGTGEAWSLYIRKNDQTDYLIETVSAAANERIFDNYALDIPVAPGDFIEIKGVQPIWGANPASTTYGGQIFVNTTRPFADFTSDVTSGYPPFIVQFVDTSTNTPTSWYWDFGDETTSSIQSPDKWYNVTIGNTASKYTVRFNAANAESSDWENKIDYITAYPLNVSFSANRTSGCVPCSVRFTDMTHNGMPSMWNWSFGGDGFGDTQNITHVFNSAGTFWIQLNASNTYSWDIENKSDLITTFPGTVANFSANQTSGPAPLAVEFTDASTGTGLFNWTWDFNNSGNPESYEQDPTHVYSIPGVYTVNLTVNGTCGPYSKVKDKYIAVDPAVTNTSIGSSINPSLYGQPVIFTAIVNATAPEMGTPPGAVQFYDGAIPLGSGPLVGGIANSPAITTFMVGFHTINATYGGNSIFSASYNDTLFQHVNTASSTTSVESSINPSVYGQPVLFTATVNATAPGTGTPTGTVTFKEGSTVLGSGTLAGGIATFPALSSFSVGLHAINATYSGDTNFTASYNDTLTQQVNTASTDTSIVSSVNPSVIGQPVTFTATVNATAPGMGIPTGTVQFFDGAVLLGPGTLLGGVATSTPITTFTVGHHVINATYGGDTNFTASYNNTLTQEVNKVPTKTSLQSSTDPSVFSQPVIFTAMVNATGQGAGIPTGTVTFREGSTVLGTEALVWGVATSPAITTFTVGSHVINATYGGDTNFTASYDNTLTQHVDTAPTTTSIVSSTNPSVNGQAVMFTAMVTANDPGLGTSTGIVTFKEVGVFKDGGWWLDDSGDFVWGPGDSYHTFGSPGCIPIVGDWNGDTIDTIAVFKDGGWWLDDSGDFVWGLGDGFHEFGSSGCQAITFTSIVNAIAPGAGTPTGTVTFMEGSTVLGTGTLVGGIAKSPALSSFLVGLHTIKTTYSGDTDFAASYNDTLIQQVNPALTDTSIVSSVNPSAYGQAITFTSIVNALAPGAGTPTGTVTFMEGSTVLGTGTLVGGIAKSPALSSFLVGLHTINTTYSGDTDFAASYNDTLIQQVNPALTDTSIVSSVNPSAYGQAITFTSTVNALAPGAGTPTGTVTFMEGSTILGIGILAGGIATSPEITTLTVGSHTINAHYGGDIKFFPSQASMTEKINNLPVITSFGPAVAVHGTTVNVAILGNYFQAGATARFTQGTATIPVNVTAITVPSRITGTVSIPSFTNGKWNLIIRNPDGGECIRANVFTVT